MAPRGDLRAAGEGTAHFYPIFGNVVGVRPCSPALCQGRHEKPRKDLEISLSQGQEADGTVLGNLGKTHCGWRQWTVVCESVPRRKRGRARGRQRGHGHLGWAARWPALVMQLGLSGSGLGVQFTSLSSGAGTWRERTLLHVTPAPSPPVHPETAGCWSRVPSGALGPCLSHMLRPLVNEKKSWALMDSVAQTGTLAAPGG